MKQEITTVKQSPITTMAQRLNVEPDELQDILMKTIMPAKTPVTNEQFVSFIAVANNYNLDPLKKEIYAFPAKGGGIQPIVSIDGWLGIVNNHPQFDGLETQENFDGKNLVSCTCTIYRKDRKRPIVITEFLSECMMQTEPWKKKPVRMLRHKAVIQCSRYAFGLSGVMDQDEYEHMEREVGPRSESGGLDIPAGTNLETGEIPEESPEPPTVKTLKKLMTDCDSYDRMKAYSDLMGEHKDAFTLEERADLKSFYIKRCEELKAETE